MSRMKMSSQVILALTLSLITIGILIWIAPRKYFIAQQSGEVSPDWSATAPNQPTTDLVNGAPVPSERFVPKGQENIDPTQVSSTIEVKTDPNIPAFIPNKISVKPNEIVKVVFKNNSAIDHYDNFVIIVPHSENEVGNAGTSAGPQAGYIPVLPDKIIAYSQTIPPGATENLVFRAPSQPGSYPFISTVDRRWEKMHGVLEVK